MSDSANETVTPDRLPDSVPEASPQAAQDSSSTGNLSVGQQWHDLTIQEPWPAGGPDAYLACYVGSDKKIVIRAFPVVDATEWRRGAWERLCALQHLQTVRSISAEEEHGWRYELSALPPLVTLQEWLALHRPGFAEIEVLVRQLAATLGALHAQGVVHLNIRPASIYIDDSGVEPVYMLGGLQEATLYTQPDLKPSEVNPLYAPPETAGRASHPPGTKLCAWDWWSVGRVVQEFLLGKHVLGLIMDRDVSVVTPELRARAERLLLEREPAGVRAGALDYMTLEPGLTPLLRGLLTGSCEARWGFDSIQRWLRHEPVLEHYDLPRNARFWVYKGRGFTLGEAAEYFTRAEQWDEGEEMLFQGDRPDTLAAFLKDSPAHLEDLQRLNAICDLSETAAWGEIPVIARRTVTAALAWLSLSNGSGVRMALRVRGQPVDVVGLAELLRVLGPSTGVAVMTALLTPAVIGFVEPFDAHAARVLNAVAAKGAEALRHGAQHGWLDAHDNAAQARIFEYALKAGALLRERLDLLRSVYATNSNAALAAVLAEKTPSPRDVVILAFTSEAPERHGYITHDEWRRQRHEALRVEAERLVTSLFWFKLRHLLVVTRVWGMPTSVFAGAVLVLTGLAAWTSRSVGPAFLVATMLSLSRVYFWRRVRAMVQTFDPHAGLWLWSDGLPRTRKEAEQAATRHKGTPAELTRELARQRNAMEGLASSKKGSPGISQPRWWDLWTASAATVLITIAVLVFLFANRLPSTPASVSKRVAITRDAAPAVPQSVAINPVPAALIPAKPALDPDVLVASGRFELVDDGFGRQLRGPLQPWTYFATDSVMPLEIAARAPASSEQSAFALVSGSLLLQPYPRRGVNVLLAVRVPTTRGSGFMIFNTRDRQLVDHDVLLVRDPLQGQTWYQLGRRRIFHLGTPPALQSEISLAPP